MKPEIIGTYVKTGLMAGTIKQETRPSFLGLPFTLDGFRGDWVLVSIVQHPVKI